MIPLITTQEVVCLSLPAGSSVRATGISDSHILAAQQRFVLPALGRTMFEAVEQGIYDRLLTDRLALPLALYTIYLAIPELTLKLGSGGIAQPLPDNHTSPTEEQIKDFRAQFKQRADTLLKEAIWHISNSVELYPDFSSAESIVGKVSCSGGVIIA